MQDYGTVLNTFSDFLIYDERKGRVLHSRYLSKAQFYEMWRFHFNKLRPDYSAQELQSFYLAQRLTRGIFGYLRHANLEQLRMCARADMESFPDLKCSEILATQMDYSLPSPGMPVLVKMTDWKDATKSSNYISNVLRKVSHFGLDYPLLTQPLTEEQKRYKEEQLYEMFLKELS